MTISQGAVERALIFENFSVSTDSLTVAPYAEMLTDIIRQAVERDTAIPSPHARAFMNQCNYLKVNRQADYLMNNKGWKLAMPPPNPSHGYLRLHACAHVAG
ncbi:hypothetical protein FH972_021897 [Carpinus fangiana]|uniref:Uncharacterized protein n=1 Tax=Carpinus fangiana TaxID=176857 RepID=A0A5N6KR08_9ROSI|nr:hypothetical protein FH972_021897 [Carpinus fangiana]